jgi:predicted Zn-dependent protease
MSRNNLDLDSMPNTQNNLCPKWRRFSLLLLSLMAMAMLSRPAQALPILRDAESETVLRGLLDPLLTVNQLNPNNVKLFIVNANSLNAFVFNGQKLFLHAGLLMRAENADQVMGVMAHEVGHIVGGHLALQDQVVNQAGIGAIATYALAAAAGFASGNSGAATAVLLGGQQVIDRSFLRFSRGQESEADAAALNSLDKLQKSADGLLEFFRILQAQEQGSGLAGGNPYTRTHPLTPERIATIGAHEGTSPYATKHLDAATQAAYARMRGKLRGFLLPPTDVTALYAKQPDSIEKRYALSIMEFRRNNMPGALTGIDGLLKESPRDPYYWEVRGQMLYEHGQVAAAEAAYRQAVASLKPGKIEPLIQLALADSLVAQNVPDKTVEARGLLRQVVLRESGDPRLWRQLAVVEGRLGNLPASYLALAEQALREGKPTIAKQQAQRVLAALPRAEEAKTDSNGGGADSAGSPNPTVNVNPGSQDNDATIRQRAQDILSLKEVAEAGAKGQ